MAYYFLNEDLYFPPVSQTNRDGVLAIGGDLSVDRLLLAYYSGVFPWFSEGEPIIWWSPDPRFVLYPADLKVSKSMKQILKKNEFEVTFDKDFLAVISNCQQKKRKGQFGTWITEDIITAYNNLHKEGIAHSVEVWKEGKLVGGLYGIALGNCFFGESMFAHVSNASKVGFITLVQKLTEKNIHLIDCQIHTEHLESLGGAFVSRKKFIKEVEENSKNDNLKGNWSEILGTKLEV